MEWYIIIQNGTLSESISSARAQQENSKKVARLLRFPPIFNKDFPHLSKLWERLCKYSLWCYSQSQWLLTHEGKKFHFLEWEENIVLFYDNRPLASIGYKDYRKGILIHHIQGIFYDKIGVGHKRIKTYYPDLATINWRDVLVRAVEDIARIKWKREVYIQPASVNSSIWWRTETAERNYDDTADRLWYTEFSSLDVVVPRQNNEHRWVNQKVHMIAYTKKLKTSR
jgi:hypothetical protein